MPSAKVVVESSGALVERFLTEYGRYVAEDRALANLYDGLKPVQRRILWEVWDRLKLKPGSTPKRTARVVGTVTGCFHPHGDSACAQSLVNLVWERYPLLAGQGNFGNPLMDLPAAAPRYTGCLATPLLPECFRDIAVAQMEPNYTGEFQEPSQLPIRLPLLLMNGSEGIAVGISTCIPPHNLGELLKALFLVLRKPDVSLKSVLKHVQGPDYPEGGCLVSTPAEVRHVYETGMGSLTYRCHYVIEPTRNGSQLVVQSGCPYFSIPRFLDKCQGLVAEGKLGWVANESGKNVRVVCFARDPEKLRALVPLLTRKVHYQFYALDGKQVVGFTLLSYLRDWLAWRQKVVHARLEHELAALEKRLEAESAKLIAIQNQTKALKALRADDPKDALQRTLKVTETQAEVILGMALHSLTRKGEAQQVGTVKQIKADVAKTRSALKDVPGVVREELEALRPYVDTRKTTVLVDTGVQAGVDPLADFR